MAAALVVSVTAGTSVPERPGERPGERSGTPARTAETANTASASIDGLTPEFVEVPGYLEFTGRMFVRPLQPHHRAEMRQAPRAAGRADQLARQRLEGLIVEYVPATDEYIVTIPRGHDENSYARELMATGEYEYVHPDWLCYPAYRMDVNLPDDPQYGNQWHHPMINAPEAWTLSTGDFDLTLAFVDTGVLWEHEDLEDHLVLGYNSADRESQYEGGDVHDNHGHGTLVMGTAGAIGNNGVGVAGVGWTFQLMPIKTSNASNGSAAMSDILDGARWSIENGARVTSASYSGVAAPAIQTTGEYIKSINGLFLYAADNSNNNHAGFSWPDVVVVGATNQSDDKASFSSYGLGVDIFAPGVSIRTTRNNGGYSSPSGTSFATPMANGVAGMILSMNPDLTPDELQMILYRSSFNKGPDGWDEYWGWGRVDLYQALLDAQDFGMVAPPRARDRHVEIIGQSATAHIIDVMLNDYDVNNSPLTLLSFDAVSEMGGTVELSSGTGPDNRDELVYTPPADLPEADTFTYTIINAHGLEASATVHIGVIDPSTFRAADEAIAPTPGVRVAYYELENPQQLPDFDTLTSYAGEIVDLINYPSTNGEFAGSGRSDEVGAVFTGYITVEEPGVYTLYTTSDDGSKLFIGDEMIVDNDGLHAMRERSGTIGLQPGRHSTRVEFFENLGGAGLIVEIEGPGLPRQVIPAAMWEYEAAVRAPLMAMEVRFGTLQEGEAADLAEPDGNEVRMRSQFGFTVIEPNITELGLEFIHSSTSAEGMQVRIDSRLDMPGGRVRLRLLDHVSGNHELVASHQIGTEPLSLVIEDIAGENRVGSAGEIEMHLRHSVVATFSLLGFRSYIDHVRLDVW